MLIKYQIIKHLQISFILKLLLFLFIIVLSSCKNSKDIKTSTIKTDTLVVDTIIIQQPIIKVKDTSDIEKIFVKNGLVNVQILDSNIRVDIRYATKRNFLGFNMYDCEFNKAYLQANVANKLVQAHKNLHDTFPNYNFLIYDATRPLSIQQMMWDSIKVSAKERPKYLSNPKYGSLHCFGAAVDLTIIDSTDNPLDMGTDFDSFEKMAYPVLEYKFLKSGKLSQEIISNRKLLRKVMGDADFFNIQTEWWHFNSCYRKVARKKYAMIINHKLPKEDIYLAQNETVEEKETIEITKPQEQEQIAQIVTTEDINIWFRVQIKISKRKLISSNKVFKGLDIYTYKHNGIYKYTTGKFKNLKQAYKMRDKMRTLGYSDCFIAGFNNKERIGIKSAVELSN